MDSFEQIFFNGDANTRSLVAQFEKMQEEGSVIFFSQEQLNALLDHYDNLLSYEQQLVLCDIAAELYPYSTQYLKKNIQLLLIIGDFPAAEAMLRHVKTLSPNDTELISLQADYHLQMEDAESALKVLEAVPFGSLTKNDLVEALLRKAEAYELKNAMERYYDATLEAVIAMPCHVDALSRFDICVTQLERFEESIDLHTWIIDQYPYCATAWYNLGNAYAATGQYHNAAEAYGYVTAIDDECEMAYRDRGDAFYELENYRDACKQYTYALELGFFPDDELFYLMGNCHLQLGNLKDAISCFETVILKNPEHHDAHFCLAECLQTIGDYDTALYHLYTASKLDEFNEEYFSALAEAFEKLGDFSKADLYRSKAAKLLIKDNAGYIEDKPYNEAFVKSDGLPLNQN